MRSQTVTLHYFHLINSPVELRHAPAKIDLIFLGSYRRAAPVNRSFLRQVHTPKLYERLSVLDAFKSKRPGAPRDLDGLQAHLQQNKPREFVMVHLDQVAALAN